MTKLNTTKLLQTLKTNPDIRFEFLDFASFDDLGKAESAALEICQKMPRYTCALYRFHLDKDLALCKKIITQAFDEECVEIQPHMLSEFIALYIDPTEETIKKMLVDNILDYLGGYAYKRVLYRQRPNIPSVLDDVCNKDKPTTWISEQEIKDVFPDYKRFSCKNTDAVNYSKFYPAPEDARKILKSALERHADMREFYRRQINDKLTSQGEKEI